MSGAVVGAREHETVVAERDALYDATERLVRFLEKHGGYMSPEHQRSLRNAKALLAEVKRTPKEPPP